jgi:hypothetical protein
MQGRRHVEFWSQNDMCINWRGLPIIPQQVRSIPHPKPLVPETVDYNISWDIHVAIGVDEGMYHSVRQLSDKQDLKGFILWLCLYSDIVSNA